MAKSLCGEAQLHAFELSPGTFKLLQERLKMTDIIRNNFGLSNEQGTVSFKDYEGSSTLNTIIPGAGFHDKERKYTLCEAQVSTGDKYCQENSIERIDLLKVDVEGAEKLVLEGFAEMFSQKRVRVVQFEYGFNSGDLHFLMKDFYQFFNDRGYQVGPLKPDGVRFCDFSYKLNSFNSGPNFVAVAGTETQLIADLAAPPHIL